jgi:hypothetical protein
LKGRGFSRAAGCGKKKRLGAFLAVFFFASNPQAPVGGKKSRSKLCGCPPVSLLCPLAGLLWGGYSCPPPLLLMSILIFDFALDCADKAPRSTQEK